MTKGEELLAALQPRLGIDFGRVINDGSAHPDGDDTTFLNGGFEAAMRTPAMPGAFSSIARLTTLFAGHVWIVSKCGTRIQERTLQWLQYNDFWTKTGMSPANTRFCRARPDKAMHCKELGITHFVDDRRDVLGHMRGIVGNLYLFGHQKFAAPTWATATPTWRDVEIAVIEGTPVAPRPPATLRCH
jgi:hypothetical protein